MKKILTCVALVFLFGGFAKAQVKSVTGVVVKEIFQNKWAAIVINARGKKYGIQTEFHASYGDERDGVRSWQVKTIGTISEGRTVQVFYKKIDCTHAYEEGVPCWLDATKIVEVKPHNTQRELAITQRQFKVFSECICSCTTKSISFIYDDSLRIDVSLGGCHDPSVGFNKRGVEKSFLYYRKPVDRFVDKKINHKVNATLKKLLLDVYNLAMYCENNNVTSGTFSETGRFQALARLRQHLKL